MSRRIDARPGKIGSGNFTDPEYIEELETRRAKHARITAAKPVRTFGEVLRAKKRALYGEDEEEPKEDHGEGAIDPHMGLTPGQDAKIANRSGARSAKVIVKG